MERRVNRDTEFITLPVSTLCELQALLMRIAKVTGPIMARLPNSEVTDIKPAEYEESPLRPDIPPFVPVRWSPMHVWPVRNDEVVVLVDGKERSILPHERASLVTGQVRRLAHISGWRYGSI